MDALKTWLGGLQPRERKLLIGGSIFTVILLFWWLLWDPVATGLAENEQALVSKRQELSWLQTAVAEATALRSGAGRKVLAANKSLLSVTDRAAKTAKLGANIKQMRPSANDKEVRVSLEKARYDDVLRWLHRLHNQGVSVAEFNLEKTDAGPGIVDVRVTLERAG